MLKRISRLGRRLTGGEPASTTKPAKPKVATRLVRLTDDPEWKRLVKTVAVLAARVEQLAAVQESRRQDDKARLKALATANQSEQARAAKVDKLLALTTQTREMISALVRHAYLDGVPLEPPFDLTSRRFRHYSQHGEDGVLVELFRRLGAGTRRAVEIGCGLNGGNTGFLVKECGWHGLMIDGDDGKIRKIRMRYSGTHATAAVALVTRENVNVLIGSHGFTGDVDLLSIDVDGMDYWIWDAVTCCTPRVVVVEYNWLFGAERAVTVPYDEAFHIDRSGYRAFRGASLKALTHLGQRKGYRLVATEHVNAFFVRDDVAGDMPACDPELAFRESPTGGLDVYDRLDQAGLELVEVTPDGPVMGGRS